MIDFTFTNEQDLFSKAAREFAETMVRPKISVMEETGEVNEDLVKSLGEAEMMAITIPQAYGGLGLGYVVRLIALEQIGRVSAAASMMLQIFGLGIEPILRFGNEEQKQKYLPDLANGKRLGSVGVTEPTGGSDPKSGRTTYKKMGDHYILNGRKCFITNSHIADTLTILAKNEDDNEMFSTFIVEKGMAGFKTGHKEHKVGMRGCNTGELVFDKCVVPKENLLGEEGKGMRISMSAISMVGRGGMVGVSLGLHTACLEAAIKFANERILYGKPISKLPAIQNKIADMKIELEAGRLLGYRAASLQDQGQRADNEFAVAKYFTTESAQRAAKNAADIHGGYGCLDEFDVTRYLRDAWILGPCAGTSDIMKVVIAGWALS
jgi:alkylation response protein AidB-like acyl-CoA dehydrogenase